MHVKAVAGEERERACARRKCASHVSTYPYRCNRPKGREQKKKIAELIWVRVKKGNKKKKIFKFSFSFFFWIYFRWSLQQMVRWNWWLLNHLFFHLYSIHHHHFINHRRAILSKILNVSRRIQAIPKYNYEINRNIRHFQWIQIHLPDQCQIFLHWRLIIRFP